MGKVRKADVPESYDYLGNIVFLIDASSISFSNNKYGEHITTGLGNAKEEGDDRVHHGVRRNRLHRPPSRSPTSSKWGFGGPQVYSFNALLELLLAALNRQRILLPIQFALAEMQAGLLELLPNPPLTRDQVRLLKTDKVVSGVEPTLGDLGVQPRLLEEFLAVFKDANG